MKIKKFISIILSALICVTALAVPTYAADYTGKRYTITHESGNVLTSSGTENGANITSSTPQSSDLQLFEFERSNGYYLIKCVGSGRYVEVRNGLHDEKAVVGQWQNNGQTCALWKIVSNSDGTVSFQNAESGLYMNVLANSSNSGTQIIQYSNDGTTAMKFFLNEYGSISLQTGKSYTIAHTSGNVITCSGTENGANITSSTSQNSSLQLFEFEPSNGYYLIKCVGSGKYVEVRNGSNDEKAVVGQWQNNGQTCALWRIISNPDGTVSFQNAESGLYMNVLANSNDPGTQIVQYKNDGTTAMKFYLRENDNKNSSAAVKAGQQYNIKHTSGNVITCGGTENGANVTSSTLSNSSLQAFEFEASDGYYLIKCAGSGRYIEVRDGKHDEKAVVGQWQNNGQKCALWKIVANSDGTYSFKNAESGLYMNVLANSNDSGTQIVQYKNDGTTAMKFYLCEASSQSSVSSTVTIITDPVIPSTDNNNNSSADPAAALVETARGEIGEQERSAGSDDIKYNDWYYDHPVKNKKSGQYAWCATFVSWCAKEAGISDIIPPNEGCTAMKDAIIEAGGIEHLRSSGYAPQYGDIIFFGSNAWQHVGIVDYCDDEYVYYINGNNTTTSPHSVCYSAKDMDSSQIWGYVTPAYNDSTSVYSPAPSLQDATFPYIDNDIYIKTYTISSRNNTVAYSDVLFGRKKGTIYASDELYVHTIGTNENGESYAYCSYPTAKGRKYAYIPLCEITVVDMPEGQGTAYGSITTYHRANSSSEAGCIDHGDTVIKLTVSGSYTQVIYNIGSASSPTGYRMAWVRTFDFNSYIR